MHHKKSGYANSLLAKQKKKKDLFSVQLKQIKIRVVSRQILVAKQPFSLSEAQGCFGESKKVKSAI